MPVRTQKTTPFKSGQTSNPAEKKGESVKVFSDTSKHKTSAGHDPLLGSIASGIPELPNRYHLGDIVAEMHSGGVSYEPRGEFGKVAQRGKGQGVYSYGGAPNRKGENAVGSPPNRKGGNALGRAMGKVGTKGGGGRHV